MAIVVHLPSHSTGLAELLGADTALTVKQAEDKEPISAGTVYIAPPSYHLLIEASGAFALSVDAPVHFSRPAIDVLFETARDVYGANLVGMLLSGASEDGAAGLQEIHAAGGTTIVQSPLSAEVAIMPAAALALFEPTYIWSPQRVSFGIEPIAEPEVVMTERSRILVVDDIDENLVALEALLRRADVDIVTARSGTEALELVLQHEFALAFIDVQMPEMDGFELAEYMRGAERSKYIPIIFLTAGTGEANRVFRGYESGAVDFLFKPVDPNILRHKTDTFIGLDQQRKKLNEQYQQLQASEALLRDAVQAREDVLAVVSHDIRNFLQAIKSGVQMLNKPPEKLGADARVAIHGRLSSTVDLMSRVIADLLDMASIRSGRIEVQLRPEVAGLLVNEAIAVHEPLAEQKGIRLTAQFEIATGAVVLCDRERILQVFSNLLGNAIKFCRHGDQIQVSLRAVGDQVQAAVIDTGPGIASSDLPLVFDAYFSGAKNRHTGTGLGLYITKRIIEAHDGRIWIESEPGKGTAVHFTLALSQPEAGATS